jgi:hypothetical protein
VHPWTTEPLIDPAILKNGQLRGGVIAFFFQYLLPAGLLFAVPLFLSVALGLSAIATGVRLLPLSASLLRAAAGIPKLFTKASPRLVVQVGFLAMIAGIRGPGRRGRPGDCDLAYAAGWPGDRGVGLAVASNT